ncbi:MAG: uncharacterized protein JWM10_1244 [Myxococcaceae bacterium]|nr:uncharacterized protein [Myxococcaceae bacterium]
MSAPLDRAAWLHPSADPAAEIFVPPSAEAQALVRHLGWLVAPSDVRGTLASRAVGVVVVAPFTQFTFFSFDLQAFLYEIFHTHAVTRVGHFVFMLGVNLFLMAGLARLPGAAALNGWAALDPATAYAALLITWYGLLARQTGLWGLGVAMVPVVVALRLGAWGFAAATSGAHGPLASPWLWMIVSALAVALSHAAEPLLPPRVNETPQWMPVAHYLFGPPGRRLPKRRTAVRLLRAGAQVLWGTLDEWWASPRLLPYNFLMLMFRAGYRPDVFRRLRDHVDRAEASGNPALDFVGVGGGTPLGRPL